MRNLAAYQDDYEALPFEDVQSRYRKRKIAESLAAYGPRRLLEVGCGLDPIFNHYAQFDRCTVVEPAQRFFSAAIEQAGNRTEIRVVHDTLQGGRDVLSREAYDFILLSSILHEIEDAPGLLDVVRSLCDEDTIVHVNVPNALSFHRLLALSMGLVTSPYARSPTQVRMQQHHTFDLAQLEELVARNGFRVVGKGTFFVKPFTHGQMAELQRSGFLSDQMLDGLYELSDRFPENGSEIWMNLRVESPT